MGHCTSVSGRLELLALDLLARDCRLAFARMHAQEPRKEAVDGAASRHAGPKLFTGVGQAAAHLLSAVHDFFVTRQRLPGSEFDRHNIAGDFAPAPGHAVCSSWFPRVEAV